MGITIGIDIGGSTTKIAGICGTQIITPMRVKANDPIASLFGAFGKFIDTNNFSLSQIEKIMVTGVGSSYIKNPIYGISTAKVEEFLSNGLGGLFLSEIDSAVIVSLGTGTALVKADGGVIEYIGGTAVGGGTLVGLSSRMLNIRDIDLIISTAESGDLSNVDLMVGDITKDILPGLPPNMTASNFGKISDVATKGDVALGIINLVIQAIGMTAIFAVKNSGIRNIVLIGNLTSIPQCRTIFAELSKVFGGNFIIPKNSEFGTAVGAALAFTQGKNFVDVE